MDSQHALLSANRLTGAANNMNNLAINGGPKAVTNQLPGWPQFDDKAISAVAEVLRSGRVNYGPARTEWNLRRSMRSGRADRYLHRP